ncbi:MAG: hypothetical protein H0U18_16175 [Pyrinomonadaceae bacterium]|nr:hypothetical protein [Pyrinomonadaceae bacterium]
MKRCPQCSFLYLDSDQLCDLDQTLLIADDFGTDLGVIEHLEQKAAPLLIAPVVHQRKLNLKTLLAATGGGLIVGSSFWSAMKGCARLSRPARPRQLRQLRLRKIPGCPKLHRESQTSFQPQPRSHTKNRIPPSSRITTHLPQQKN